MTMTIKHQPETELEDCHIDARAAGCFGGEADPCHSGQPAPMDADMFMRLYTQSCVCKKPEEFRCTLGGELE